jgi:ribonuclease PH
MKPVNDVRRPDGRAANAMRPLRLETGVMKFAEGSARIELGDTHLLVSASVEPKVPKFLVDSGKGWVTGEYSMLPRATQRRSEREVSRGRPGGRTLEIQRLIGRSLRAAVDLSVLGEHTVTLDCDALQADGGTRTAAITAAYVALVEALARLFLAGDLDRWPIVRQVAAISVGYVDGQALLDLEYCEDSVAEVDMNIVATADGELIEIQGTGEGRSFSRGEMDALLDLAMAGIAELVAAQNRVLAPTLAEVDLVRREGRRRVAPRSEKELWGPPK